MWQLFSFALLHSLVRYAFILVGLLSLSLCNCCLRMMHLRFEATVMI